MLASRRCPRDWTDYRHLGHGCALRHAPPGQHIRAMVLLRDHGDCVWMDPSQIGIYRGIGSDARDLQCDSVHVPTFLDKRGGRAADQISRQGTSFA